MRNIDNNLLDLTQPISTKTLIFLGNSFDTNANAKYSSCYY